MTALLIAWLMIGSPQQAKAPSLLGEWTAWRITSGDVLEKHPKQEGKLLLKANGAFTWHSKYQDMNGSYRIHGRKIMLEGISISPDYGDPKESRSPVRFPLVERYGLLWDGDYDMGVASFVYSRPGKKLVLPPDKDWPSLGDFFGR